MSNTYFKRNKYNAKKQNYASIQGFSHRYDSLKEASYAMELDWRIKAGEVKSWSTQHKFSLDINETHICNYYIDFRVELTDGSIEYVEVKGFETDLWRMKWRITKAILHEIAEPNARLRLIK